MQVLDFMERCSDCWSWAAYDTWEKVWHKTLAFSPNRLTRKFVAFHGIESRSLHPLIIKLILETISQAELNCKSQTVFGSR